MKGKHLVAAAIALLGAMLGLWLWMRKGDAPASARSDGPQQVIVPTKPPGSAEVPSLPGSGSAAFAEGGSGSGSNERDYVVGDVHVRDHRAGTPVKIDLPPNVHPPESRRLPSELTQAIAQKVRTVMEGCTANVPREARGPGPRLEGQIVVGIADKKLTITKSIVELRDVFGAAVEPTKACIEQKSVGLDTAAADQADLASYSINVNFAIP